MSPCDHLGPFIQLLHLRLHSVSCLSTIQKFNYLFIQLEKITNREMLFLYPILEHCTLYFCCTENQHNYDDQQNHKYD